MYKKRKSLTSILLIVILLFNTVSVTPAFAEIHANSAYYNLKNEKIKELVDNPRVLNIKKFSEQDQQLINQVAKNPKKYLEFADIINDTEVIIYNTDNPLVKVGSTNGYIEIISKQSEDTFVINGVEHKVKVTFVEDTTMSPKGLVNLEDKTGTMSKKGDEMQILSGTWKETSYVAGPWNSYHSGWYDIHLENAISNYTLSALTSIIGFIVNPLVGTVVTIASLFLASEFTNTSVAKIYKVFYNHGTMPNTYKMESHHCYAVYEGQDHFLGIERKYYEYTYMW